MATHYINPDDGYYWVQYHLGNKNDWALGRIKNGNFSWLTKLNGFHIAPITTDGLLLQKVKMVKIEKPPMELLTA